MTMAWNIEWLRKTGDSADATLADMLQLRLEARGDFDLPQAQIEQLPTPEPEQPSNGEQSAEQPILRLPNSLIVLADSNEPSQIDLLSTIPDIEKTPRLNAEIQAIVAPIVRAARLKMPERPTQDDVTKHRSFRQDKLRDRGVKSWDYSQRMNDELITYDFKIEYAPGHEQNILHRFIVHMSNGQRYITTTLTIGAEAVESIQLYTIDPSDNSRAARQYLGLPPVAETADGAQWNDDILGGYFAESDATRHYSYPTHLVTFNDNAITHNSFVQSHHTGSIHSYVNRTYDPQKDAFQTIRKYESIQTFGQDIETTRVIEFIQTIVDTIPVKPLE